MYLSLCFPHKTILSLSYMLGDNRAYSGEEKGMGEGFLAVWGRSYVCQAVTATENGGSEAGVQEP